MQNLQEIFDRIQKKKKEFKELKAMYRDALEHDTRYKSIVDELKNLKEKKKQIETDVQVDMGENFDKMEELKGDIESDKMMLSDIAMTTLMDGKTVEVTDQYNNRYEPDFRVNFKKTNQIKKEQG